MVKDKIVNFLARRYGTPADEELVKLCCDIYNMGSNKEFDEKPKRAKKINIPDSWRTDMSIYTKEMWDAFRELSEDEAWKKKWQEFYPNLDLLKTIEKSILEYWGTEAGYKNKKSKRGGIDWRMTFTKALGMRFNQVYKDRGSFKVSNRGFVV